MSQKLYEENNIQDIANAIRSKNGTQNTYTVGQMGNAIRAIKTQPDLETLTATENRTYLPSTGKDGFSEVTVNVPSAEPDLETLTATENRTYLPSTGKDGFSEVTVDVPQPPAGGGGNLYTNNKIYLSEEQITDLSGFTPLYDSNLFYGNNGQKVAQRLAISDESSHTALQSGGWSATGNAYYDGEKLIGAYGGYDFGQEISITKVKFWLGRYSDQNISLSVTVEYLDGNGNWNELRDLEISTTLPYPTNIFEVAINKYIYGIRWIHKNGKVKSSSNNIIFSGMSIYRGIGALHDAYTPDSTGLIVPPNGYDGFGPLFIPY